MVKVLAFLAPGLEEVECLAVVDLLRRAGMEVPLVSMGEGPVIRGAHGIRIVCDLCFDALDPTGADALFLPGGMPGTANLAAHEGLCALLRQWSAQGKRLAAICAAPSVLGELDLLRGRRATCYPGWEHALRGASYTTEGVVTDGMITTARGLGFALDLGLELVRLFQGDAAAEALARAIQHPRTL